MKKLLEDHELKNRRIKSISTGNVYGIQDVYLMEVHDNKYLTLLTYTNGNVGPEFRSHGQIDWEMIEEDTDSDIATFLRTSIENNRNDHYIIPKDEENDNPISEM